MNYNKLLNKVVDRYKSELGDNLVGFYVHGSIAFGCFNPLKSDVDFIAVVKDIPSLEQKIDMMRTILDLEDECTEKGFEMSVVLEQHCKNFIYPTPYELHFGRELSEECSRDIVAYCKKWNGADPDLAAHFTVINSVGITLYGKDISEVFSKIPTEYYLDSIKCDVENAEVDIFINPVYVILNLCRVYAYIKDGLVCSKRSGGEWGLENIDKKYAPIITGAINAYISDKEFIEDKSMMIEFAKHMIQTIFK